MKRTHFWCGALVCLTAVAIVVLGAAPAAAYENYQSENGALDNCSACHPGFDAGFGGPLHDLHFNNITTNCDLCHPNGGGSIPVSTLSSGGGAGGDQGCRGCHGVEPMAGMPEDSWAAGLRLHHENAGAPPDSSGLTCQVGCHAGDPMPLPEDTVPLYYPRTDTSVSDPCLDNLDNDGDLDYDGADSDCQAGCTSDADCDDGEFCNGAETCDTGTGECQPGTPVDCDDGVSCTADSCNETTDACENVPDDGFCDDDAFCNGAETCDVFLDCQPGEPVDCDDGIGCTDDACNEDTDSCDNVPNDANCDNGLFCDGDETCDPALDCQPGTPVECPPGEVCDEELDQCVPEAECVVDADCDNGLFCDGAETCVDGTCVPGTPVDCDDGIGCTDDACNEDTDSCDNVPNDANCDDGMFCNGAETCDPALDCQPGTPVECPPGEVCDEELDQCVPEAECVVDADCDNGLFCDGAETCVDGTCVLGTPVDCDDGIGCTDDACNEDTDSCDNVPNDANCDDGMFCNGAETCDPALDCQAGTPPCDPATEVCNEDGDVCEPLGCTSDADCDDGVDCTVDTCDVGTGECSNTPDDGLCDDGLFCTGAESCDPEVGCVAVSACPPAIDGCVIRGGECDEENDMCVDVPDDSLCDNGMFCDGEETCDLATTECLPGTPPCDPDTEICDEEADICEPAGPVVDLDIYKFQVSKRVVLQRGNGPSRSLDHRNRMGHMVKIKLWVVNGGMVDEPRDATVTGVDESGAVVYTYTMPVSDAYDDEASMFKFPSYAPESAGIILWMATIDDDDPDVDGATASTEVRE